MNPGIDIVLFPANEQKGTPAIDFKLVAEDDVTVTYQATFERLQRIPTPAETASAVVVSLPDTTPSPDDVDFDEFPDLPDAS